MQIWIYGSTSAEVQRLSRKITAPDTVAGASVRAAGDAAFPQGGLTAALYAAMCGEVDILLSSEPVKNALCEVLAFYGVSVKSASSFPSKNS